jgi:hypothetical protein
LCDGDYDEGVWHARLALTGSADLAQGQYFDEPAFVNYLAYLLYWKRPEYAHFIVYPQCLRFLELLVRRTRAQTNGPTQTLTLRRHRVASSKTKRFAKSSAIRSLSTPFCTGSSSTTGASTRRTEWPTHCACLSNKRKLRKMPRVPQEQKQQQQQR